MGSRNEQHRLRFKFLHEAKLADRFWKHPVFRAKICESQQALLLASFKAEPKILAVIAVEKFLRDRLFLMSGLCHDALNVGKIFVS